MLWLIRCCENAHCSLRNLMLIMKLSRSRRGHNFSVLLRGHLHASVALLLTGLAKHNRFASIERTALRHNERNAFCKLLPGARKICSHSRTIKTETAPASRNNMWRGDSCELHILAVHHHMRTTASAVSSPWSRSSLSCLALAACLRMALA